MFLSRGKAYINFGIPFCQWDATAVVKNVPANVITEWCGT